MRKTNSFDEKCALLHKHEIMDRIEVWERRVPTTTLMFWSLCLSTNKSMVSLKAFVSRSSVVMSWNKIPDRNKECNISITQPYNRIREEESISDLAQTKKSYYVRIVTFEDWRERCWMEITWSSGTEGWRILKADRRGCCWNCDQWRESKTTRENSDNWIGTTNNPHPFHLSLFNT